MNMNSRVFISYSTEDRALVNNIELALRRLGYVPVRDETDFKIGASLTSEVIQKINSCSYFLLIWSTRSAASEWVKSEIGIALGSSIQIQILDLDGVQLTHSLRGRLYLTVDRNAAPGRLEHELKPLFSNSKKNADTAAVKTESRKPILPISSVLFGIALLIVAFSLKHPEGKTGLYKNSPVPSVEGSLEQSTKEHSADDDTKSLQKDASTGPFKKQGVTLIAGTVIDRASEQALAGAIVSIPGGGKVATDRFGYFELNLPEPKSPGDPLTVFAYDVSRGVHKHADVIPSNPRDNPITIRMGGTVTKAIAGFVTDVETDQPLPNIHVTFLQSILRDQKSYGAYTDVNGTFGIDIRRSNFIRPTQYVELIVTDTQGIYKPFRRAVNIDAPIQVQLERILSNSYYEFELPASSQAITTIVLRGLIKGAEITIKITGSVRIGQFLGTTGPNGKNGGVLGLPIESYSLVPEISHAAVMYRVHPNTEWLFCGEHQTFICQQEGDVKLEFFLNDRYIHDNSGHFTGSIRVGS